MTKIDRGKSSVPALPPPRHQPRPSAEAARRNDLLRRGVLAALRRSGCYSVVTNMRVRVPEEAHEAVRRGRRSVATQARCDTVVIDMVLVDAPNGWAGGYAFCSPGAQSLRARRRIEENLRAAELVLGPHVSRTMASGIDTVTVGIIDGCADPEECDDLTIAVSEIADSFEVPVPPKETGSFDPPGGCPARSAPGVDAARRGRKGSARPPN
jgi:hypothetical protein